MGRVAAPAVVMQSLSSFMSLGLNQLLTRWSQSAVFVLGAYFKLQTFIFMPIFGISSGLIPILSYNYGSGALRRVSASVRFGQQFTAVLSLSGALLLSLLASPLLRSAFRASPEALAMGAPLCGSSPSPFSSPGPALSSAPPFNPWAAAAGPFWWPCCARSCSCSPPLPFCWP